MLESLNLSLYDGLALGRSSNLPGLISSSVKWSEDQSGNRCECA